MPRIPENTAVLPRPVAKEPARRFTDKPDLDPSAVWSLPTGHAALTESRTLFPSTVVDVDDNFEGNLLVSGENNRKLGKTITKGKFKGYALYGLSLEERATCPDDCSARAFCYGNGMQMARRHRITEPGLFFAFLEAEIYDILGEQDGLMVRLHVLGDFPDEEYVESWGDLLRRNPTLACYGYTHRKPRRLGGDRIGDAIETLKREIPDRFRIRWSGTKPQPDGAIIIDKVPDGARVGGAIVCPAQTDATACCASCGLCWETATRKETIAFVKHGKRSLEVAASNEKSSTVGTHRNIAAVSIPSGLTPAILASTAPIIRMVKPQSLLVESAYQRDLSGKSIQLIRKIVAGWDWTKFKPPVCAETKDGLVVIDGQHTAIAAATHPGITEIPVMVNLTAHLERRAASFVSHNRDRLVMTPAQIFYGDLAAGDKDCKAIMECVVKAGASIPRLPVALHSWKPGQISAVGELREGYKRCGREIVERALKIAVAAKAAPISLTLLRAIRLILTEDQYRETRKKPDSAIVTAIISVGDIAAASELCAADLGLSRFAACAALIAEAVR